MLRQALKAIATLFRCADAHEKAGGADWRRRAETEFLESLESLESLPWRVETLQTLPSNPYSTAIPCCRVFGLLIVIGPFQSLTVQYSNGKQVKTHRRPASGSRNAVAVALGRHIDLGLSPEMERWQDGHSHSYLQDSAGAEWHFASRSRGPALRSAPQGRPNSSNAHLSASASSTKKADFKPQCAHATASSVCLPRRL
jgi:hypothetical protein